MMDLFIYTVFTYPVVIYSVLFTIVILYWLVSAMGLFDFGGSEADADVDIPSPEADADLDLDLDVDADVDMDVDAGSAETVGGSSAGFLTGLLLKFGLHGIPMTIIISLMVIIGWFLCSVTMQFILANGFAGLTLHLIGTGVFAGSLVLSAWLTGKCISPIRRFLDKNKEDTSPKSLCGRPVTVRSGTVTATGGQAVCVKDGYTFILQVQALAGDKELKNGDTAYILEYHAATNTYTIVSEDKFTGQ